MSIRFVILIVLAGALGVYYATRAPVPPDEETRAGQLEDQEQGLGVLTGGDLKAMRERQTALAQRDLPGEEPPEPATFEVQVAVQLSGGKNELCFNIVEDHGYYAETLDLEFWWAGDDGSIELEDSPLSLTDHINGYVRANEPLVHCIQIVPAELDLIGGSMGTDENWRARVKDYNRARVVDPDPLPVIARPFENATEEIITG